MQKDMEEISERIPFQAARLGWPLPTQRRRLEIVWAPKKAAFRGNGRFAPRRPQIEK